MSSQTQEMIADALSETLDGEVIEKIEYNGDRDPKDSQLTITMESGIKIGMTCHIAKIDWWYYPK